MGTQADALQARAVRFSVRLVRFVRGLERDFARDIILRQLLKSGTSESANYRAARRARSTAEFIARMGVVVEEADETEHWLEVLLAAGLASGPEFELIAAEAAELRAIFVASLKTARANRDTRILRSSNP